MRPLIQKQNGQALVETLYSLPLLAIGVSLVMGGLHSLFVFYLADYWTYQAAMCLAQEMPKIECRKSFVTKTKQLPMARVDVEAFESTSRFTFVKTVLHTNLIHGKQFQEKISLPLISKDFRRPL